MEYQAAQVSATKLPLHQHQIKQMQQQDPTIKTIILQIQASHDAQLNRNFVMIDNVLYYVSQACPPRLYVLEALRATYLDFYHNHQLSGHFGFHKLLHRICSMYYWPKLWQSILAFLQSCPTCQDVKTLQSTGGSLTPITVKEPFGMVGWDLMRPIPISLQGNRYILEITKYLTRWCEVIALPDSTASTVARVLLQRIIFPHGCPQQLLSDQGFKFRSVLKVLAQSLGIKNYLPHHTIPKLTGSQKG